MISRLGLLLSRWAHRWVPDPFIFALLLSFVTVALALLWTDSSPGSVLLSWRGNPGWDKGFWAFLKFSMQMCLILVTGHALALAPPVRRLIAHVAEVPRDSASAAALVSTAAMITAYVNWGFGLIVGAVLAREVARSGRREGRRLHYPLLGAAGYSGLMVWHGGLSGSAPLKALEQGIGLRETLLSTLNLTIGALLLVAVPALLWLMAPRRDEDIVEIDDRQAAEPTPEDQGVGHTPASLLERSVIVTAICCAGAAYVVWSGFTERGISFVDLDSVPFVFLFLGMALHVRPIEYVRAIGRATQGCAGIILQFPFYAGISGIMVGTGLQDVMSRFMVARASAATFPFWTFVSACIVNLFIPSGGGQWMVQGPVMLEVGERLGVPAGKTVMCVAYGDELTNMLQPFWALALLGVTGLRARDIIGYSTTVMLLVLPLYAIPILVLP